MLRFLWKVLLGIPGSCSLLSFLLRTYPPKGSPTCACIHRLHPIANAGLFILLCIIVVLFYKPLLCPPSGCSATSTRRFSKIRTRNHTEYPSGAEFTVNDTYHLPNTL